jgi:hypothetical protein
LINDQQKQQHFHLMCALDHLQMAGFRDMKFTEALILMSTVILGDKEKMTEVLNELSEYEQQCQQSENDQQNSDESPNSNEVH